MKKVLISCISLFGQKQTVDRDNNPKQPIVYSSGGFSISALQTNEACVKFLLKKLAQKGRKLDTYIRVQSSSVEQSDFTMKYLDGRIAEFCETENITAPEYFDCFLGEDEKEHRYDKVLNIISKEILKIAGEDDDVSIYLDMAGGKRDNYIFIQLLTKLLSFYNYKVHTYYADITGEQGVMVNTDLSFRHMQILDAVNVFIRFGSAAPLRECFNGTKSPTVKGLLKVMEEFSDSVQLCSTDIADIIPRLNQQLEQAEKNVSYDTDDLFVIGTMIPMIRKKFDIKADNSSRGILNIIKWCLENNLIQQALTIYNEKAVDLIFAKKFIYIDNKIHGEDINRMMNDRRSYERKQTKLIYILGEVFKNMYNNPNAGTKEMKDAIGRYKSDRKNMKLDKKGNIICRNLELTMGSVFCSKEFMPNGVRLNIDDGLCRMILSDIRFASSARNRVNHASGNDSYDKLMISLFSLNSYPFSSYPNTFTPKNVKKDLLRAVKNLEDALDMINN